ncbi:hypothetical protein PENSPDRAFT_188971 [Peniophora sp. CONT]|nr:hypothetical protein PENSPDRAFT_188971 [Peniophora sp. CONT]
MTLIGGMPISQARPPCFSRSEMPPRLQLLFWWLVILFLSAVFGSAVVYRACMTRLKLRVKRARRHLFGDQEASYQKTRKPESCPSTGVNLVNPNRSR